MLTETPEARRERIFSARMAGATVTALAEQEGVTAQTISLLVIRHGRRVIDDLELRLLANRKTRELELFMVPDHGGPDFDRAVSYFQWCVRQLTDRGVDVRVYYRPAANGVVFGVEDVTDYRSREDA